jgi:hypothetical protein
MLAQKLDSWATLDGGNLRARVAEIVDAAGGLRHVVFVFKFDVS